MLNIFHLVISDMKLHQLRYFQEIIRQDNNVSRAASVLCTSQSGVSKQIKLLEEELGITLFTRKGRTLTGLTVAGREISEQTSLVMQKVDDIQRIASQHKGQSGTLSIATTHTQAKYVLPRVIDRFVKDYPKISLNLHQGTPVEVARMVAEGEVDVAIATEALANRRELFTFPCYQWARRIVVNKSHPLIKLGKLTLADIAEYPIITYVLGFTGRYQVDEAFAAAALEPNFVLTAVDADVIKTYVRLGLGVGIIANMAFDDAVDKELLALDASHLFGISTTLISIKKDKYISAYLYRFIEMFAPHLTEKMLKQAVLSRNDKERQRLFKDLSLPLY